MQLNASNKLLLAALLGLSTVSVGLKAAAGTPDNGNGPAHFGLEDQLTNTLGAQGFSTEIRREFPRSIVYAQRAGCRLSVRDAREGTEVAPVFTRDAAAIGPVRYLYRGKSSDMPPATAMWVDRLQNKVITQLGIERPIAIPVALATSPGCDGQDFGLNDIRVSPAAQTR